MQTRKNPNEENMKSAKDHLIFALDLPTQEKAKTYIRQLADQVGMFKIGLELFIQSGPSIIRLIQEQSEAGIFLDLKLHDIPATVRRAMERIAQMKVSFATVHCGESRAMLQAAVEGGKGQVGVLGVTVLTSVSQTDIRSAGFRAEFDQDLAKLVELRAGSARDAGCAGVVCSPWEAQTVKKQFGGDFLAVTPGIRPEWERKADDQARITTPSQAIANGADYLVVGRPIRDAGDPREAADRIVAEIQSGLSEAGL